MRRAFGVLTGLLATCLGCAGAPATDAPPNLDPDGAPEAATSAKSEPAPIQLPEPQPELSPFVVVSAMPPGVRLYAISGQILGYSDFMAEEAIQTAGLLEGDRYVVKPELDPKLNFFNVFIAAAGKWPQGVDMLVAGSTGRTGIAVHQTLQSSGWTIKSSTEGRRFSGLAMLGDSVVAIELGAMVQTGKPEFVTLRGPRVRREFTDISPDCEATFDRTNPFRPRVAVTPLISGSTRSGALVSFGTAACGEYALEVWPKDSVRSQILPIPAFKSDGYSEGFSQGLGADEAFFRSGNVVLHFDGSSVRLLPSLPTKERNLSAVAQAQDGSVFALSQPDFQGGSLVSEAKLFRLGRTTDASWQQVALPAMPDSMAVDGENRIWLTAGTVLLRQRKSAEEKSVEVGTVTKATPIAGSVRKPLRAPGPLCPQNVVVLYGFTKVTPDDYDFPLTRKALKGHREFEGTRFVVAKDGGERFFSALVPNVKAGTAMVSLIEKQVKGAKPQLLCASPEIVRELQLDLNTGEVVKN